jgi:hypothetical protein
MILRGIIAQKTTTKAFIVLITSDLNLQRNCTARRRDDKNWIEQDFTAVTTFRGQLLREKKKGKIFYFEVSWYIKNSRYSLQVQKLWHKSFL